MNNPDITAYTLGALLSWPDDVIRRNAISIMKRLQALQGTQQQEDEECERSNAYRCGECPGCIRYAARR